MAGHIQHGVAEHPGDVILRSHEVGRPGGMQDVFPRPVLALGVVGLQQCRRRPALYHRGQLPAEVFNTLQGPVRAPGPERGYLVGGIADKECPVVNKGIHLAAAESIDARPFQLPLPILAQHGFNAGADILEFLFLLGVGIPTQLEINTPDIVRLLVQQGGLARVERCVEPEAALGGKVCLHDDIGDQEAVFEHLAPALEPQGVADRAVGAVSYQQVVAGQLVVAVPGGDRDRRSAIVGADPGNLVQPAQLDLRQFHAALHHELFHVVLLQVYEGGHLVVLLRQQIELIDLLLPEIHLAEIPGHTLVQHGLAAAVTITDLQRAFGQADGAGADTDGVIVIQYHGVHALQRQVHGGGEARRTAADDHDRVVDRLCRVLVGTVDVRIDGIGVAAGHWRCFRVAIIVASETNIGNQARLIKQ